MGHTLQVERDEPDVTLTLTLDAAGGQTGESPVVAVRDPETAGNWLDFSDGTFKTSGWTTRQQALTEISAANAPGVYEYVLDLSAVTIPAGTDILVVEYSNGGSVIPGVDHDFLILVASNKDIPADVDTILAAAHGSGNWTSAALVDHAHISVTYDDTNTNVEINTWLERDGVVVTSPTSSRVTWRNQDGTQLFQTALNASPDAQGVFQFTQNQTLAADTAYYAVVEVTDGTGTVTSYWGVPTEQ